MTLLYNLNFKGEYFTKTEIIYWTL